jgi:hypothetical protein
MNKPQKIYVFVNETVLASWAKDAGSLGTLAFLAWVNHTFCGGSLVYDILAVIMFVFWMMSKAVRSAGVFPTLTYDELRSWAQRETAEPPSREPA